MFNFRENFNSTRFKNEVLKKFPGLKEFRKRKEIYLPTYSTISNALSMLKALSSDNQIFKEVAKILRRNMFPQRCKNDDLLCQESIQFMNFFLYGPESEIEANILPSQAVLSIFQVIKFNSLVCDSALHS